MNDDNDRSEAEDINGEDNESENENNKNFVDNSEPNKPEAEVKYDLATVLKYLEQGYYLR